MVSAGGTHTVLLRSDGCAVACGWNFHGTCNIPPLDGGVTNTQVLQVVLIQCFSGVMAVQLLAGGILEENATFPPLDEGVKYTHILQLALNQDLRFLILLQEQVLKQTLHGVAEFA